MTTPRALEVHPVRHWLAPVRQAGFPLDHPYLEQCWAPVLGPSSVLLLRHCNALWADSAPARVPLAQLGRQLGLGGGTAPSSHIWRTVGRVVDNGFAVHAGPGELHVYTEVPPVPARLLARTPTWCRAAHDRLLGEHLDALARSSSPERALLTVGAPPMPGGTPHRMAALLELRRSPNPTPRRISR